MTDIIVAKEAAGDFLVKGVMTMDEAETIFDSLEYSLQLYSLGRQLLLVSILDKDKFKEACECLEGAVCEDILQKLVSLIKADETPCTSAKRAGLSFGALHKSMTGEDDPAVKATKESVIAWMESFAAILSSEYFVEDETVDTFLSQIGVVKHFLR